MAGGEAPQTPDHYGELCADVYDDDFQSLPDILTTSSATGQLTADGIQLSWSQAQLTTGGQAVTGAVHDAGDGCQASDYAGAAGKIALADTVGPF